MKIQDFILLNKGLTPCKYTWCSSVMQDTEGNFYSYGQHYPLLFKVKGVWLVNKQGYSNTTARHIYWAKDFANSSVDLSYSTKGDAFKLEARVKSAVSLELKARLQELDECSTRAYVKYNKLEQRIAELKALKNVLTSKN